MLDTYNYISNGLPSSKYTIINISLVVVNLLVVVYVQLFSFGKRRLEDRQHQHKTYLYTNLVVDNIKYILNYFSEQQGIVKILLSSENKIRGIIYKRKITEQTCDEIEKKYENFSIEILPNIACYSEDNAKKIIDLCDEFQSKCAEIASKYCNEHYDTDSLLLELSQHRTKMLVEIFNITKEMRPL